MELQRAVGMNTGIKFQRLLAAVLGVVSLLTACASGPRATQSSNRQEKAQAMFAERCKTAGEKIHRTVDNVDGVYLMIASAQ